MIALKVILNFNYSVLEVISQNILLNVIVGPPYLWALYPAVFLIRGWESVDADSLHGSVLFYIRDLNIRGVWCLRGGPGIHLHAYWGMTVKLMCVFLFIYLSGVAQNSSVEIFHTKNIIVKMAQRPTQLRSYWTHFGLLGSDSMRSLL